MLKHCSILFALALGALAPTMGCGGSSNDESDTSFASVGDDTSPTSGSDTGDDGGTATSDASADDDGADSSDDDGQVDTTAGDGADSPTTCAINDDCAADEICNAGDCVDALSCDYELRILALTGTSCDEPTGSAEVRWEMLRGMRVVHASETSSCPLSWPGDVAPYATTEQTFELVFYEVDPVFDDDLFTFCWDAACGPVPADILHDGGWSGTTTRGTYYFEIELEPAC